METIIGTAPCVKQRIHEPDLYKNDVGFHLVGRDRAGFLIVSNPSLIHLIQGHKS